MNIVALVCARAGSKGLPGKNSKRLRDKPLIAYSIDIAIACERVSRVLVSTDDPQLAEIALQCGAEVPFIRPDYLAEDTSPEWEVWRHAIKYLASTNYDVDALVVLPPTAPLRGVVDVDSCIDIFIQNDCDGVVCVTKPHRNPYYNMVVMNEKDYCSVVCDHDVHYHRRQEAPRVLDLTTVCYVMRPKYVLSAEHLFSGVIIGNEIPVERSVDIDTQLDFDIAEFLIGKTLGGNGKPVL